MSDDSARIEISAASSQLDAGLRDASSKIARWSLGVSSVVKQSMAGVGKMAAPIATGAAHRAGAMATDFVMDQARATAAFEGDLVRLGIAGGLSATKLDQMRKAAAESSTAFGVGRDKILAGTQTYVDLTGDVEGAAASMEMFSKVSAASAAGVDDVAAASAAFAGIGVKIKDMPNVFSGLIAQGKQGAVSLKDFAGELSGILPRWAKFKEGSSMKGLAEMGAVFQVARQGFGSASEAATGMQALMGALVQNAEKFQSAGVKIFDRDPKTGVKTLRSFEQIMASIEKSRLVKDPTLMTKALGSKEAEQTVTMLLKARQSLDGQESAYRKLIAAGGDYGMLQKDLETWLTSAPGKAEKSWEKLKNTVASIFTPERIQAFAEGIEWVAEKVGAMFEKLDEFGDWITERDQITENPFGPDKIETSGLEDLALPGLGDYANEAADTINAENQSGLRGMAKLAGPAGDQARNAISFDENLAAIRAAGDRKSKLKAATSALMGGENEGARKAGQAYLAQEMTAGRIKPGDVDQLMEQLMVSDNKLADAINQGFAKLAVAMRDTPIMIDNEKVHAVQGKATNVRTKVR